MIKGVCNNENIPQPLLDNNDYDIKTKFVPDLEENKSNVYGNKNKQIFD